VTSRKLKWRIEKASRKKGLRGRDEKGRDLRGRFGTEKERDQAGN